MEDGIAVNRNTYLAVLLDSAPRELRMRRIGEKDPIVFVLRDNRLREFDLAAV